MANINKISGIGVTSILKIRGLAKTVLSKAKGRPFAVGSSGATLLSQSTTFGDASYDSTTDIMTFDGTGDYATFGGDFRFTDKISVGAWFKTTATGDRRIMSSHVRSVGNNGYFLRLQDGVLKYRHPAGGTGELTGPSGLNNGAWHHVMLTWTPSAGYKMYVDGSQIGSGSTSTADTYNTSWDLYVGANSWSGNSPYALWIGQIGGAYVLNDVLSAQQISDMYFNGPVSTSNTFGGPIDNSSTLLSSIYTRGSNGGAQVANYSNLKYANNVMSFDGTTYIADLDKSYLTSNFTFSTWFKFEGNSGTSYALLGANNEGTSSPSGEEHGFHVSLSDTSISTTAHYYDTVTYSPTGGFNDGQWHHYAIVISGGNSYTVYIDGTSVGSKSIDGVWGYKRFGLFLGKWKRCDSAYSQPWIGTSFVGKLANSQVFNTTKNSTEIATIYSDESP